MANQQIPEKSVTIHYRRFDRGNGNILGKVQLAEMLSHVLGIEIQGTPLFQSVQLRSHNLDSQNPDSIFCWNNFEKARGAVFGTSCVYSPSKLQAVINTQVTGGPVDAYDLDQIAEAGGRNFLQSIAYWMAIEDHFYLIQSQSIQTRAMENYFSWLFQEYGLTGGNERVVFQTSLDQDVVGGDLEDITSVNVGGVFEQFEQNIDEDVDTRFFPGELELSAASDEKLRRQQIGRTTIGKELWEFLSQLMPEQRRLEEIEKNYSRLRQADPAAEIGANLEFFVTMKKRNESSREAKKRALQSISNGLRDLPEGTLVLKGKDGVLKNGELTLKCPRNIKLAPPPANAPNNANSSLLDVENTFKQMLIVHDRYIEDKKI